MFRFIYVAFLVFSYNLLAQANPDDQKRPGTVFPRLSIPLTEDVDKETGRIMRSPRGGHIGLATIEHLSPGAILHLKSQGVDSHRVEYTSFHITTNRNGLQRNACVSALPEETKVASVSLRFFDPASDVSLVIYPEETAETLEIYPQTICAALNLFLSKILPEAMEMGHFPNLRTVTFVENRRTLGPFLQRYLWSRIGPFSLTNVTDLGLGGLDFWQIQYTLYRREEIFSFMFQDFRTPL